MSTVQAAPVSSEQRLVLENVSWRTYERLLRIFDERPAFRLTYDRGCLEIMTISHEHESYGRFLGRLAITLTEELGLSIKDGGSTTFKRRRKQRGLEPDDCYWIVSEPLVRGKRKIDLRKDPPPDLGIEIDISRSSLVRLDIYAALRVPEVWRFDGNTLTIHILNEAGIYLKSTHSLAFPGVTAADLARFLTMPDQMEQNAVIREFRAWIQERIAAGWK